MSAPAVEEDVMRIRKQFEKMTSDADADQSQALDLLKTLSGLKVNLNILTTTRIGMTVNALRYSYRQCSGLSIFQKAQTFEECFFNFRKSSRDDEVIALAKSLIKTWKKFVPESADKKERKKEEAEAAKKAKDEKNGEEKSSGSGSGTEKAFPARPQQTSDQVSLSCLVQQVSRTELSDHSSQQVRIKERGTPPFAQR
jgi:transcription elongation factor S-II